MRDIKEILIELCCSYTIISVGGSIFNLIFGGQTNNVNVIVMFVFCTIAVFVLSLHKLLTRFSPLFMIVVQYLAALGLCTLIVFFLSRISDVSKRGWIEYLVSFTIPYIIGAGLYYYRVFADTKKQDALIKEIQQAEISE
ncbi:MAG: hypothetical protein J6U54_01345 [Clostridiales bacterium]|nr:hypothetical protein [Clostridiales bacterium]